MYREDPLSANRRKVRPSRKQSVVLTGEEPGLVEDGTDESCKNQETNGNGDEDIRQQRLQKAYRVSEEWKSTLLGRSTPNATKRPAEHTRPSLSYTKFKQQAVSALSTEMSTLSDSKVYSAIQNILFLLHEAELQKENIKFKSRKLKEDFDRDEAAVRAILAESNIPTAISDSLLDSHFTFSSKKLCEETPDPTKLAGDFGEKGTMPPVAPPFIPTNVPPPPVHTATPPPIPSTFATCSSVSLPDLTQPPPNVKSVASVPPAKRTGSSPMSSSSFTMPPPNFVSAVGTEPVPGVPITSCPPPLPMTSCPPPLPSSKFTTTAPPKSFVPTLPPLPPSEFTANRQASSAFPPNLPPPPPEFNLQQAGAFPSTKPPTDFKNPVPPTTFPPPPPLPVAGPPPPVQFSSSLSPPEFNKNAHQAPFSTSTAPPEFKNQPPASSIGAVDILNAALRPCSSFQFSGPFGPPIAARGDRLPPPPPPNPYQRAPGRYGELIF
ncbi:hypothetical protein Q1695_010157 [Nippostrongylus brasiliensis]|nr:hypothetical protein Q1695_010157 [Nippostrongylus brasiliensis]